MNRPTTLAFVYSIFALLLALVICIVKICDYLTINDVLKLLVIVLTATIPTFLLAFVCAEKAISSVPVRLIAGAAIPISSLFLVCEVQTRLWSSSCNRQHEYNTNDMVNMFACSQVDEVRLAFPLLSPFLAIIGIVVAVIATHMTKCLTRHSGGTPSVALNLTLSTN